jgi:hypothetical protein
MESSAELLKQYEAWKADQRVNEVERATEKMPKLKLAAATEWVGKPDTTEMEAMDWVANMRGITNVKPEDSPSALAWSMYLWTLTTTAAEQKFWELYVNKALAFKFKEQEEQQKRIDDGRVVFEVIDRLEQALKDDEERSLPASSQVAESQPQMAT